VFPINNTAISDRFNILSLWDLYPALASGVRAAFDINTKDYPKTFDFAIIKQ
jgi:hypothetical protein